MSNELVTLLLAMAPISELRGALPVAVGIFKMPGLSSYWLSVLGNMIPVFFLTLVVGPDYWLVSQEF